MRAIQVQRTGGPECLMQVELPEPVVGPRQVRVRAHAIGIGRPDVLIRMGTYKWMPPLPAIPGAEMAGFIDAVGEEVDQWVVGDRVLVSARELDQRGGCYAEAIVVNASAPYRLPTNIHFADSVSLPNLQLALALMKVAGALDLPARVGSDSAGRRNVQSNVLISGASGGVATMLSKLAKHLGYRTIGTSRTSDKKTFALTEGFDEVITNSTGDIVEQIRLLTDGRNVDFVFDHLGGEMLTAGLKSLAPFGTFVSYNAVTGLPSKDTFNTMRELLGKSLALRCFSMHTYDQDSQTRRELMETAIRLMAAGQVTAPSTHLFPFSEIRKTHELLDQGLVMGKFVMQPINKTED